MGKKYDEKAVWPWQYNHGNAYEWPFGQNPNKDKEKRRKK